MKTFHRTLIATLVLAAALAGAARCQPASAHKPIHLHIFLSQTCTECKLIKRDALTALAKRLDCDVVPHYYDVDDLTENKRLVLMERRAGKTGNDLPVVFVGKHVLGGVEQIEQKLEPLLKQLRDTGGPELAVPAREEAEAAFRRKPRKPDSEGASRRVALAYFHDPGCAECSRVERMLTLLASRHPKLEVKRFDRNQRQSLFLLEALGVRAGVLESKRLLTPAVFAGGKALVQSRIDDASLEQLYTETPADAPPPWEISKSELDAARQQLWLRSRNMGVLAVLAGGLVDGINPCAFATLVFFVCCLASTGRSRAKILSAGIGFTLGVFVVYFLTGVGLTEVLLKIESLPLVSAILTWVIIGLTLVFFVLSMRDFIVVRRGNARDMSLKLPHDLRLRINALISRRLRAPTVAVVAVGLGAGVSILEFVCTGQVYLPLIRYLTKLPVSRARGYALLALYNLAFILPLIIVFLAVYFGLTSERLTSFMKRHVAASKLFLAFFFLGMALLLLSVQLGRGL